MSTYSPFRKVFEDVATRCQMFALFNRHDDEAVGQDRLDGSIYSGEWFEISQAEYVFMLDVLPPLFMRTGMFGMSEYKAGYVTSVFVAIRIRGRKRWFHGFCDLSNRQSPDALRAAIVAHETGAIDSMTRAEKLELIWNNTLSEFKGIVGASNTDAWPADQHGRRSILVYQANVGRVPKLLEDLTDLEIEEMMPVALGAKGRPDAK